MKISSSNLKWDDSGLNNLKSVMTSNHRVRVGIFGGQHKSKGASKSEGKTNAEIGFMMEFGTYKNGKQHIPARSWLMAPMMNENYISEVMEKTKKSFMVSVTKKNPFDFFKSFGAALEELIGDSFETMGFGTWELNAPSTIKRKGSDMPLIDTGQLRRSVASEVV